jgi:antitoxin VapB
MFLWPMMRLNFLTVDLYFGTWQPRVEMKMQTARVGKNNRAQVVTIPLEFRFPEGMKDVYIRKVGDDIILCSRATSWKSFVESDACASGDFMAGVEDLPVQDRNFA